MLRLNDDCLCEIFCRLPLNEQVMLMGVCTRFRDIVELVWGGLFREFDTRQTSLTKQLLRDQYEALFAIIAADHLEKLTIANTHHLAFSSYLGRYNYRPELLYYLTLDYPYVRELDIKDTNLHDGHMRLIARRFPALQVLRVCSGYVTGAYICEMQQLRELYMPNCALSLDHLSEILDGRRSLTHLNINAKDDQLCYRNIAHTLSDSPGSLALQSLVISEGMFSKSFERQLCYMRNLRTLRISCPFKLDFTYFYQFFGPSVVEIRFAAHCKDVLDFPINSEDARNLGSLKTLHLDHYIPKSLLQTLQEVTSLRELYFSKNALSSELAEFIANSTHLEHIQFKCTPSRYQPLNYLSWFERVFLSWLEDLNSCLQAVKAARPQPLTVYAYGFDSTQQQIQRPQNVKHKAISAAAAEAEAVAEEDEYFPTSYIEFEFSKDGNVSHFKHDNIEATVEAYRSNNSIE